MPEPVESSTSGATSSISDQPDLIGNTQLKSASTGPRTPEGKSRSARNASKHKILRDRILPEEEKTAAYINEELFKDLDPQCFLEYEVLFDLVLNRLQKRRIDKHRINSLLNYRGHCFEITIEKHERRLAEQFLRPTGIRRPDTTGWNRLAPETCVQILGALRAKVQESGPSPDQDLDVLGRIYGQEPTALGAMVMFCYRVLQAGRDQCSDSDEKRKVENKDLREKILGILEAEIQHQRDRDAHEKALLERESSSNVTVLSPDVEESIQRYHTANTREFAHLLDTFERIRRLRRHA